MSAPVGSLSSGPACEAGKLIVQVIGKDHPANQKIVLCDDANKELKGKLEPQEKDLCSSVLHVWDCTEQANRQLSLEIASLQGKPIRLPLFSSMRSTPRQVDAQWNQVVPVLPFVALSGSKSAYDLGAPVLARAGFVYVFYQKKLWRELEVRIADGKTTYHDVDVAHYRQGKGFKAGERKTSGQPLDDIWLPALWNNQRVQDLQLCFSEIQLNAPRLQRLEQDAKLRDQRCKGFDLSCSNARFKELYKDKPDGKAMLQAFSNFDVRNYSNQSAATQATVTRRNLDLNVFPVSVAAPQRARVPAFEWLLDHPARYLSDLSGQFPVTASQQAKAFLAQCAKGISPDRSELLELTAVADALENSLPTPEPEPGSKSEPTAEKADLWQAQSSAIDVLAKARQRQICGILLEDPRFRLRHLKQRVEIHHELLKLCATHATQQVNHASALLVQQLVVPRNLQGQLNPLNASMDKLSTKGKQDINRCTATVERAMVWQHMNSAQDLLAESLQQSITQQTVADHLSLDGFDYLSALFVISHTIAAIAVPASRLDPLAPSGDVVDAISGTSLYTPQTSQGQKLLRTIVQNTQSPLHLMLWPESNAEIICAPYKVPTTVEINTGDGKFRATELAKYEDKEAPAPQKQMTLDAGVVDSVISGGSDKAFAITTSKNINGILMSVYDTLQGAVDIALKELEVAGKANRFAANEASASRDISEKANDRLNKIREQLGARARQVNVTLHGRGVQQLRSMLPNTFGQAYFMRRGNVTQNYYLFGLEDLPAQSDSPKTIYGEFVDKNGKLLGSTDRSRIPGSGVEKGEHLVLVMPRNHSTAKLISNMNKQLINAQHAGVAANTANSRATDTGNALNKALDEYNKKSKGFVFKVLNSKIFPIAVLMIEMWNVNTEANAFQQTAREKSLNRALGGGTGAALDLLIAMEALAVKLLGTQSALEVVRKPLFRINRDKVGSLFGELIGKRLEAKITARLLTQSVAGLVFAVLNIYDAWYAWQWNDQAMYGYLLMAGGALAGVTAGLLTATPLLNLHPLGWLSLLLIGIGAGLVLWLSSTPLEDWLTNGPFGVGGGTASQHLKDPKEAFYRLIGLLAGINITVSRNPAYQPGATLDVNNEVPYEVRSSDTLVRLESLLPGLIASTGSISIKAECRLAELITYTSIKGSPSRVVAKVASNSTEARAQRLYNDALELYFSTPLSPSIALSYSTSRYSWAVRAQFSLQGKGETRYFPAPAIKDPTQYDPTYSKADFNKTNRPFWADHDPQGAS